MKKLSLVLIPMLVAAGTSANEETSVRYRDVSGRMSVTVNHDINVREAKPIATRGFSFDLSLATDPTSATVMVTIDRANGSYTAHAQKQRLGTRHLTGQSFPLSIDDQGRRLAASEAPVIDLGPIITEGFSIAGLLADALPTLPEAEVAVGTTWTTRTPVRSLEGWAWGVGRLTSTHRVTAIGRQAAHTIVTVTTEAEAQLAPIEGARAYTGDLRRSLRWTFDATDGQLMSMSMEQETKGMCELPQGEIPVEQLTRIELAPLAPGVSEEATR